MSLKQFRERITQLSADAAGLLNKRWGVSDPIEHLDIDDATNPKAFIESTIDKSGFQFWVVFVAGIGFLTDAYDIFALNTVITIFKYLYIGDGPDGSQSGTNLYPFPYDWDTILLTATLAGICIGMFLFGILGDIYGRRKMYGLELIVLILGSVASSMASRGELQQMSIIGWLVFWRVIMGIGIGADYPLSAVITSEFAPRKWRARMLATVFWMQPIGQLLVLAIAAVAIKASQSKLQCNVTSGQSLVQMCSDARVGNLIGDKSCDCAAQLDTAWRAIVGVGAVPAAVALYFRMTIPPSPRFRMDVLGMQRTAIKDTKDFFEKPTRRSEDQNGLVERHSGRAGVEMTNVSHLESRSPVLRSESGMSERLDPNSHERTFSPEYEHSIAESDRRSLESDLDRELALEYPKVTRAALWRSLSEFRQYFWTQGNWRLLLGTAGTWFLLDIPYYGLGLSLPAITGVIWPLQEKTIDLVLLGALEHQLVITSIGAVVGGAICIAVIQYITPKTLQLWSFVILAVLLLVTGIAFEYIAESGFSGLIVLYTIMQLFFQLGPNTTTYIIAAELWPTKFRCTSHGFSAAAGKVGAIVGQVIIANAFQLRNAQLEKGLDKVASPKNIAIYQKTGNALKVFFAFMVVGAVITWLYVPETRDPQGISYPLSHLEIGYQEDKVVEKPDGHEAPAHD